MKWAEVVPQMIGNPLYHWTHLELSRFFGIEQLLNPQTARHLGQMQSVAFPDDYGRRH
jgi:glucuronate isomerase